MSKVIAISGLVILVDNTHAAAKGSVDVNGNIYPFSASVQRPPGQDRDPPGPADQSQEHAAARRITLPKSSRMCLLRARW